MKKKKDENWWWQLKLFTRPKTIFIYFFLLVLRKKFPVHFSGTFKIRIWNNKSRQVKWSFKMTLQLLYHTILLLYTFNQMLTLFFILYFSSSIVCTLIPFYNHLRYIFFNSTTKLFLFILLLCKEMEVTKFPFQFSHSFILLVSRKCGEKKKKKNEKFFLWNELINYNVFLSSSER